MSLFAALLMRSLGKKPSRDVHSVACGADAVPGKYLAELGKGFLQDLSPVPWPPRWKGWRLLQPCPFFFSFLFFPLLFAHRYSLSIFVALVIQPCSCKGSACMWRRHWNSWRKGAELRTAWGVAGAGALQACPLGLPSSMIIFWLKFTCWAKPRYFTELHKGGWGIPGHSLPGQPAGPLQ